MLEGLRAALADTGREMGDMRGCGRAVQENATPTKRVEECCKIIIFFLHFSRALSTEGFDFIKMVKLISPVLLYIAKIRFSVGPLFNQVETSRVRTIYFHSHRFSIGLNAQDIE